MRIRLTLDISRTPKAAPEEEQFEHRDTDSFVENTAVRYSGFVPEGE